MATIKQLSDWVTTFKSERVQEGVLSAKNGSDFISGETTVLVSGPKTLNTGASAISDLIPIGLVQNFVVNQGRQVFTYNEIGSSRPFMIPGRTRISASISRVLFDSPSLLYVLNITGKEGEGATMKEIPSGVGGIDHSQLADLPTRPYSPNDGENFTGLPGNSEDQSPLGYFMSNLGSSFFNKPIGLGVIMFDNENQPFGGFYLEECYITGHNLSIASQAVVILENASLFATQIVPIAISEIGGIS